MEDATISVSLIIASVWVYELGNVLALYAFGVTPQLVVGGVLPIGVTAVSAAPVSFISKFLQVLFVGGLFLFPFRRLWNWRRPATRIAIMGITGCLVSSLAWEMLGFWSASPSWEDPALFFTLTTGLGLVFAIGTFRRQTRELRDAPVKDRF